MVEFIESLEAIRKRPGMYVGGTDQMGLHHLLFWVLDDVLANARGGRGSAVLVRVGDDGSCLVADEGRWSSDGAPMKDSVDCLTRELLAGVDRGVVPEVQIRSYLPVVRALSRRTEIHVRFDGDSVARVAYDGIGGDGEWSYDAALGLGPRWKFVTCFWPDPEIFGAAAWDLDLVRRHLREMVASCPGFRAELGLPGRQPDAESITMPRGMADMLGCVMDDLREGAHSRHPDRPFRLQVQQGDLSFDVAVQWHWGHEHEERSTICSWANTVRTREGSHVLAVKQAVRGAGLDEVPYVAAISVFVPQPRFSSPTKDRLTNPEIRRLVADHLTPALRRLSEDDAFAVELDWMARRRAELAEERQP